MRELHRTSSDRASPPLHENGMPIDRPCDMNSPVSRYAGNPQTRTLLQRRPFRELDNLSQRNHGVRGGSSERSIRLSAVAPHTPTDPFPRCAFADCINDARSVAVRNDTRIGHPDSKGIFAFLDIAGVHP
jgi:hypothetical protein